MTHLLRIGYPLLGLSVFARQVCLPVPAIFFLLTAGALAKAGELSVIAILLVSVLGCLGGDLIWFEAGRRWGNRIMRLLYNFSSDPRQSSSRGKQIFRRWGLPLLLIAKFVPGLDGVVPPLAGTDGCKRSHFLLYDAGGSLLWAMTYAICGYVFADKVDVVLSSLSGFWKTLAIIVGIPFALFLGWRVWNLTRMILKLRLRQMSPALLMERIHAGNALAIVDLLDFEQETEEAEGIPGAVRANPARLRRRSHVIAPKEVSLVLYCSSANAYRSARVALALRKKGFANVWVLDGGLAAWKQAGYPLTKVFQTEEEAAERLGIRIVDDSPSKCSIASSLCGDASAHSGCN